MRDGWHKSVTVGVFCHCRLHVGAYVAPLFTPKVVIMMCEVVVMIHAGGRPIASLVMHSMCQESVLIDWQIVFVIEI